MPVRGGAISASRPASHTVRSQRGQGGSSSLRETSREGFETRRGAIRGAASSTTARERERRSPRTTRLVRRPLCCTLECLTVTWVVLPSHTCVRSTEVGFAGVDARSKTEAAVCEYTAPRWPHINQSTVTVHGFSRRVNNTALYVYSLLMVVTLHPNNWNINSSLFFCELCRCFICTLFHFRLNPGAAAAVLSHPPLPSPPPPQMTVAAAATPSSS